MTVLEQRADQEIRTEVYDAVQGVFADYDLLVSPDAGRACRSRTAPTATRSGRPRSTASRSTADRLVPDLPLQLHRPPGGVDPGGLRRRPAGGHADHGPPLCRRRRARGQRRVRARCGPGTAPTRRAPSGRCRRPSRMQVVIAEGAPAGARPFRSGRRSPRKSRAPIAAMHSVRERAELARPASCATRARRRSRGPQRSALPGARRLPARGLGAGCATCRSLACSRSMRSRRSSASAPSAARRSRSPRPEDAPGARRAVVGLRARQLRGRRRTPERRFAVGRLADRRRLPARRRGERVTEVRSASTRSRPPTTATASRASSRPARCSMRAIPRELLVARAPARAGRRLRRPWLRFRAGGSRWWSRPPSAPSRRRCRGAHEPLPAPRARAASATPASATSLSRLEHLRRLRSALPLRARCYPT